MSGPNEKPVVAIGAASERLSYKFQRLRERIRQAIVDGQLSGKLPGERELARQFDANPKTLSKALTDLAGEGLLDRSIGRGTYVHGAAPEGRVAGRWLILCSAQRESSQLASLLKSHNPNAELVTDPAVRPSFISQFDAVIDLTGTAPQAFYRDLLVRGIPTLLLDCEPQGQKVHAVVLDRAYAASCLARDLLLAGHRQVLLIGADETTASAVRLATARYSPHAAIQSARLDDTSAIVNGGYSAFLCLGEATALRVRELVDSHSHLGRVSIAAVAVLTGDARCSGIYISAQELVQAGVELIRAATVQRPAIQWLTGTYSEHGTIFAVPERAYEMPLVGLTQPTALSA